MVLVRLEKVVDLFAVFDVVMKDGAAVRVISLPYELRDGREKGTSIEKIS